MLQDYRLGVRMLLKYPGLTLAGGLALAVAIGVGAGWYDLAGKLLWPEIPLPDGDRIVSASDDRTLRLFGFVDVGNVFGENERITAQDLRASAGFGLSWLSPIGPLRIAIAEPFRTQPGDRIQRLQFQIGTSF